MAFTSEVERCKRRGVRLSLPELSVRPPPNDFQIDKFLKVMFVVAAVWTVGGNIVRGSKSIGFRSLFATGDDVSDGDVFDYVVVGAGAAGGATAARLALSGTRVLLLEAGAEPKFLSKIPLASLSLMNTSMDWSYKTISNNASCLGLVGGMCRFARGKCLGGTMSMNRMMYTRGNKKDYDFNIPGWSWEEMEPYFLRYEGLKNTNLPESSMQHHNFSGILPIENFSDSQNPWHTRLINGFQTLNLPYNPDVNAKSQIGVSQIPGYVFNGERITTANSYLNENSVKKSLKIAKNTRALRVIIDKDNVARGILALRNNNEILRIFTKHEVVLSAGAIETPHILMLSGVGPKGQLEKLGIPVKSDLPVGENMSDHILPLTYIQVDHEARSASNVLELARKGFQAAQWLFTKTGPLASAGLGDITTFLNTKCYDSTKKKLLYNSTDCEIPTMQTIVGYLDKGMARVIGPMYDKITHQTPDIRKQIFDANDRSALIIVSPVLLRPKSRGKIELVSANPLVPPMIYPNYLDEEDDVKEMVRSINIIKDLVETGIDKNYNASLLKLKFPDCPDVTDNEEGYWECYSRQMTFSAQHAVGTASLGPVLDEELRVRGIKNLRVGDASVLPLLPRGNTAASIIAIGERLAHFLLKSYK